MKPSNEKELWEFVGEVRTDIKAIKTQLAGLPCSKEEDDIKKLKEFQDKQKGELKMLGFIWGVLILGLNWVLSRFK